MTLKEQLEERRREFEAFNRWEEEQPPIRRDPAALMADAGWLWRLVPPGMRLIDPDPEKTGVRAYHAALEKLISRR